MAGFCSTFPKTGGSNVKTGCSSLRWMTSSIASSLQTVCRRQAPKTSAQLMDSRHYVLTFGKVHLQRRFAKTTATHVCFRIVAAMTLHSAFVPTSHDGAVRPTTGASSKTGFAIVACTARHSKTARASLTPPCALHQHLPLNNQAGQRPTSCQPAISKSQSVGSVPARTADNHTGSA